MSNDFRGANNDDIFKIKTVVKFIVLASCAELPGHRQFGNWQYIQFLYADAKNHVCWMSNMLGNLDNNMKSIYMFPVSDKYGLKQMFCYYVLLFYTFSYTLITFLFN